MDIGSNSIHLTLARIYHDGGAIAPRVEIMATLKDAARLAAFLGPNGNLSEAGIERAIETLRRYRRVADEHQAEVRAAATAALRAARNSDEVLRRVAASCGVQIQVISGADEARLVYEGVLHGLPEVRPERVLCVDVGGGSTELLLGENGATKLVASVPIGAVVITQELLAQDPLRPRSVAEMRRRLMNRLAPHRAPIDALKFDRAIGTGGSIQRAVRVARARRTGDMRGDVNGHRLAVTDLRQVLDALVHAGSRANRLRIPGIDPERADTLLGGALIFDAISQVLGIEQWTVSTAALRLGLLMDTWKRRASNGA